MKKKEKNAKYPKKCPFLTVFAVFHLFSPDVDLDSAGHPHLGGLPWSSGTRAPGGFSTLSQEKCGHRGRWELHGTTRWIWSPNWKFPTPFLTGFSWIFHDKPSISWYPPFQETPFARETILANGFTIGRLQQEPVVPLQLLQPPDHEHSRSNAALVPLSKARLPRDIRVDSSSCSPEYLIRSPIVLRTPKPQNYWGFPVKMTNFGWFCQNFMGNITPVLDRLRHPRAVLLTSHKMPINRSIFDSKSSKEPAFNFHRSGWSPPAWYLATWSWRAFKPSWPGIDPLVHW